MILKRIFSEAKVTDEKKQLCAEIKEKDENLGKLRDETINNIITIFKKDTHIEKDPTSDDIIDWFNLSDSFGDFVFEWGLNLSTYSISDFTEHDSKLAKAIKDYLIYAGIMDENNVDLTLAAEDGKRQHKMSILEQCITAIDDGTSREESLKGIKEFYDKVDESLNEEHVCEKCGHSPCTCEKLEEENELEPNTESTPTDPIEDLPEQPIEDLVVTEEEPKPQIVENAFSDMVNSAIKSQWDIITNLNGIIATFDFDYKGEGKEDIIAILNQLVDDSTISIGMLHKIAELISTKTSDLLDQGEEKAEEIIEK